MYGAKCRADLVVHHHGDIHVLKQRMRGRQPDFRVDPNSSVMGYAVG